MRALLIRHGQTNYNVLGLCNDDPSRDVHLTEKGRREAHAAAKKLSEEKVDAIFVSEFPRTQQTAEIINAHHNAPIFIDKRLNDRKTGFEGKPTKEFCKAIPLNRPEQKINGGESFIEQKARVKAFLNTLKTLEYSAILIIGHSEPLRVLFGLVQNLSDTTSLKQELKNCAVLEVTIA